MRDWTLRGIESQSEDAMNSNGAGGGVVGRVVVGIDVVLACSYGPDSMCLLDLLRKCELKVVVAHVNHKVRSESDEEYRLLEEYCKKSNIPFEGMSILEEINSNFESKAREIRYNFFEKILTKYKANYLFTAHHGDDLVETILMRISRGASFGGYAGLWVAA